MERLPGVSAAPSGALHTARLLMVRGSLPRPEYNLQCLWGTPARTSRRCVTALLHWRTAAARSLSTSLADGNAVRNPGGGSLTGPMMGSGRPLGSPRGSPGRPPG